MNDSGFLTPWVRDIGAATGLVVGLVSIFKAYFHGRPYSYLEPDVAKGILKLYVFNSDKRSIVVNGFYVAPRNRWYVAPNASNLTDLGHHETLYGKSQPPSEKWRRQNVIIEPGKRHEFFLGLADRDSDPSGCLVLMSWQPLGGLPIPRVPLLLHKTKRQMRLLFRARKGRRDTVA